MHYRNGREAHNGDRVIQFDTGSGKVTAVGVLVNATPGNDHCNGFIVSINQNYSNANVYGACLSDCLHVDDLADILNEKGLDKRQSGK